MQLVLSLQLLTLRLRLKLGIWPATVFPPSQQYMEATKWRLYKWILKKLSVIFWFQVKTVTKNVSKSKLTASNVKELKLTIKVFHAVSVMVLVCLTLKASAPWLKLLKKRSKLSVPIHLEIYIKSIFLKRT